MGTVWFECGDCVTCAEEGSESFDIFERSSKWMRAEVPPKGDGAAPGDHSLLGRAVVDVLADPALDQLDFAAIERLIRDESEGRASVKVLARLEELRGRFPEGAD